MGPRSEADQAADTEPCDRQVGLDMAWRLSVLSCHYPEYPWSVEARARQRRALGDWGSHNRVPCDLR